MPWNGSINFTKENFNMQVTIYLATNCKEKNQKLFFRIVKVKSKAGKIVHVAIYVDHLIIFRSLWQKVLVPHITGLGAF